jgi:hypothetical protein
MGGGSGVAVNIGAEVTVGAAVGMDVGVNVGVAVALGTGVSVGTTATAVSVGEGLQEARGTVLKQSNTPRIDSSFVLTLTSLGR